MARLLIGLGSGRSGTVSLSRFLDAQPDSFIVHEGAYDSFIRFSHGHLLPWEVDRSKFERWLRGLERAARGARFCGDVASYLLPYVPLIRAAHPDTRFLCLRRSREETVRSFMRKTPGVNPWITHDGTLWRHYRWDKIFPKVRATEKAAAIGEYWDVYYAQAEAYERQFPNSFRIFDIVALNTREGQGALLDFAGFPRTGRVHRAFRSNRATFRWFAQLGMFLDGLMNG